MNIADKIKLLINNSATRQAYFTWRWCALFGRRPRRRVAVDAPNVAIGEWISFSEYASYFRCPSLSEQRFINSHLPANRSGVVFDIGANVGLFTCWLGGLGHQVHSFEPIPETFCRLARNVQRNGLLNQISLYCMAVGERSGVVQFEVREDAPGRNAIANAGTVNPRNVPCTTIDDHAAACGISCIDFLKMDIEGMEPMLLLGAQNMMRKKAILSMLIEVCPRHLNRAGLSARQLHEIIADNDYECFLLNEAGLHSTSLSALDFEQMDSENVAVLPRVNR